MKFNPLMASAIPFAAFLYAFSKVGTTLPARDDITIDGSLAVAFAFVFGSTAAVAYYFGKQEGGDK